MTDSRLERFRTALLEALRDRGLDPSRPITVAEIYQDLVPYRTHRDILDVEMNGDYEHLLMRALAGQGGVLELQSSAALEQLREELEQTHPNTGLYRDFAAVDVTLADMGAAAGSRDDSGADEAGHVEVGELAPDPRTSESPTSGDAFIGLRVETPPIEAPEPHRSEAPRDTESPGPEPAPVSAPVSGEPCQWCRQVLPDRENLNFCPFCGTDLRIVPCGSCGEALEPGWRFCIACGDEVASTA